MLSEDQPERNRHDQLARDTLRIPGLYIPLKRLFLLKDYPRNGDHLMALYAEGYSVSNFLVSQGGDKGRQTFLHFVATGMRNNDWDSAVHSFYGYRDVNDLERAWVGSLRQPREAAGQVVKNSEPVEVNPAQRVVSRQTAPPLMVALEAPRPIARSQRPRRMSASARPTTIAQSGEPAELSAGLSDGAGGAGSACRSARPGDPRPAAERAAPAANRAGSADDDRPTAGRLSGLSALRGSGRGVAARFQRADETRHVGNVPPQFFPTR